ncbi:unnamed protein product [Rhodiola kirilowii]
MQHGAVVLFGIAEERVTRESGLAVKEKEPLGGNFVSAKGLG